jgi:hypothetical protein
VAFSGHLVHVVFALASSTLWPRLKAIASMLWIALFPVVRPTLALSRRRSKMMFWNRPSRPTRPESFSKTRKYCTRWSLFRHYEVVELSLCEGAELLEVRVVATGEVMRRMYTNCQT